MNEQHSGITSGRASRVRSVLSLDGLIGVYGCWTVGFWIALAFGLGWAFALGLSVLVASALVGLRHWPSRDPTPTAAPGDSAALTLVLVIVLLWPAADEIGRPVLAGLAVACLVTRLGLAAARGGLARRDLRPIVLGAIAFVTAVAFEMGWATMTVVVCGVAAVVVVRPGIADWLTPERDAEPVDPVGPRHRRLPTLLLWLFGLLLAIWHVGVPYWSEDNAYYLNKAAHFSASPSSFGVKDYMFGVDGAAHFPLGNILSSFEPLIGLGSALSGLSPERLLFGVVVPGSMLLIPFAIRYAASGLDLARPHLVAGLAAASIILMTSTTTSTLFAQASYGKTIGRLVAIPLVFGAAGYLLRRKDANGSVRATLASIGAVGLSPSLAGAVLLVLVPFAAVGLHQTWTTRQLGARADRRSIAALLVPVAVITMFALFGQRLQAGAGDAQTTAGFKEFPSPELAWLEAFVRRDAGLLALVFLAGSAAVLPLLPGRAEIRRAVAVVALVVFGIVFAPWSFDLLVDDLLGLNYFAWRFFWAIPAALVIGAGLAAVDARRRLGLLTLAAATIGLGLSGPSIGDTPLAAVIPTSLDVRDAPAQWPWEAGIPPDLLDTARAISAATPDGERFVAPPHVEEVTMAVQIDDYPTYGREVYAIPVGSTKPVPPGFALEDRLLLARGMTGNEQDATPDRWRRALETLDIATVCLDDRTTVTLRRVVEDTYSSRGSAGECELWVRAPS